MNWLKSKANSRIRIPILVNTIHVAQASTQTRLISRRKYRHRFKNCLIELMNKYPRLPAHDDVVPTVWLLNLLKNRDDLYRLSQTLEDLDQRLENLSLMKCWHLRTTRRWLCFRFVAEKNKVVRIKICRNFIHEDLFSRLDRIDLIGRRQEITKNRKR